MKLNFIILTALAFSPLLVHFLLETEIFEFVLKGHNKIQFQCHFFDKKMTKFEVNIVCIK